jgi:hypothetical protein
LSGFQKYKLAYKLVTNRNSSLSVFALKNGKVPFKKNFSEITFLVHFVAKVSRHFLKSTQKGGSSDA